MISNSFIYGFDFMGNVKNYILWYTLTHNSMEIQVNIVWEKQNGK